MVLFEIWSVGKKPFSKLSNNQAVKLLQTGHCQPPPPGCPRTIYKLMVDCWYYKAIQQFVFIHTMQLIMYYSCMYALAILHAHCSTMRRHPKYNTRPNFLPKYDVSFVVNLPYPIYTFSIIMHEIHIFI